MSCPSRNPRRDVELEISNAGLKFGAFHSTHEGLGVLTEEYRELCDAIRSNTDAAIYREAVQVAAVALRLAESVADAMDARPCPFSIRSGWGSE